MTGIAPRARRSLLRAALPAALLAAAALAAFVYFGGTLPFGLAWHRRAKPDSATVALLQRQKPFWDAVVTAERVVAWWTAADFGPQVREGCPGYLFLNDEFVVRRTHEVAFAQHLKIVGQVADLLARRRIPLVIAVVPDKSRVEAKDLCGLRRPRELQDRLGRIVARLRGLDAKVIDLLPPLQAVDGDPYYRTDTHWNERGAQAAAEAVAVDLRGWGLASAQRAVFRVKHLPPRERIGDLIRVAGLDRVPWPLRPPGDIEAPTVIDQSASPGVGLLEETPVPDIVLLGTSFSQNGNFAPFLALALGAPIDDRAEAGGGLIAAARAYFADPLFAKSPPKAIVWEIPERIMQEKRVPDVDRRWGDELARLPP